MNKTIVQMAKEAGIEKFRTSRDPLAAEIAERYFRYGAQAVLDELMRAHDNVEVDGSSYVAMLDTIRMLKGEAVQDASAATDEGRDQEICLVDLGLPSGTCWADRNLGADRPEAFGDYYRFGETHPFTESSPEYNLSWDWKNGCIAGGEHDAARAVLTGQWHIPMDLQLKELLDVCTRKWETVNGVKGWRVTGPNGNSIFLPAAGYRTSQFGRGVAYTGVNGYYWSAMMNSQVNGRYLSLDARDMRISRNRFDNGFSIRPVMVEV